MSVALGNAARLREMLRHYENSLGLKELTAFERDVLYAFQLVQDAARPVGPISSEEVKRYHSLEGMAHATYHRAVKGLVEKGFLVNATYGKYSIRETAQEAK